ncbi:hypothetical protein SCUCBS95973_002466 [Sporothrix curviconia]|uniref:Aminoglycoside phosphotransferase domain-containing protein n=1 Tax=Sporothrix curviconia TaxID=1260050 RepID=A0ABP0B803_9PEZI
MTLPLPFSTNKPSATASTRYVAHNGLSYRDSAEYLPDRLPRSDTDTGPVFTHSDIAPRNIIVDDDGRILALLDWESSGWFPDWWEYAQMMGICDELEYDWQHWMERTRPVPWDISAIQKALAPAHRRGLLVGVFSAALGSGYTVVAWISFGTHYATNETVQWRVPLALACVAPIAQAIGVWFIPESPRWLVLKDRKEDAWTVVRRLHHDPEDAEERNAQAEFTQICRQVAFDK